MINIFLGTGLIRKWKPSPFALIRLKVFVKLLPMYISGGKLWFLGSSQYDVCVHKPVIIGSGDWEESWAEPRERTGTETDLKYGAALWFACCAAQAHESPHHNVFHGQASIFMKPVTARRCSGAVASGAAMRGAAMMCGGTSRCCCWSQTIAKTTPADPNLCLLRKKTHRRVLINH